MSAERDERTDQERFDERARVHDLVNDLTKPLYVYRMASAMVTSSRPEMRRSALTRQRNAARDIHDVVLRYVADLHREAPLDAVE